jgi:hypothetical protein
MGVKNRAFRPGERRTGANTSVELDPLATVQVEVFLRSKSLFVASKGENRNE